MARPTAGFVGALPHPFQLPGTCSCRYYARLVHEAVDGAGTDDTRLVRVLAARKHRLYDIGLRYMELYGKALKQRVDQDVSGNYGKVRQRCGDCCGCGCGCRLKCQSV